jgi:NDP-sugar pyrophosphorylase family protein
MPAAGKGTRLNLPYPKEILRLDKQTALIDKSFLLFDTYDRNQVEFIVVINEEKTDIIKYLSKYKNRYNISFTYQKPDELEYTGAIKSAKHLFGENNLVLLPDTLLTFPKEFDLLYQIQQHLQKDSFSFFFKSETDPKTLSSKGCLRIDSASRILDYEDKPSKGYCRFNGYWCAFAFKKNVFDQCISFMEQSTLKKPDAKKPINNTAIYLSKAIKVKDYKDLGTWDEIAKILYQSQ